MLRTVFLSALVIALLVSGCTSAPETIPAPLPTMENKWTVKMTHSGGIMGLQRSVEVASDGSYTVTDERANQTVTGRLSDDELMKLRDIVAASAYVTLEKPGLGGCADCFIYDLEIQGSGKKFSVQLDDITLPDSGLEPLVTFLRGLINSALK